MSTETRQFDGIGGFSLARALALGGGAALTWSYVSVLHEVTTVVGDSSLLLAVIGAALALSVVLAGTLRPRVAAILGAGLFAAGVAAYLSSVPLGWRLLFNLSNVVVDVIALLSGVSVLRMTEAGAWAVGIAPAPVFLSWYLLLRRRYAVGVGVGGAALLAFGLTGDAELTAVLAGTVGGAAALGFGEIELRRGSFEEMEVVAAVLALMIVVTTFVPLVPTGDASPFVPEQRSPTIEGGVVNAQDRVSIVGSIRLSPEVRFVVESPRESYWRVNAYDRYTGQDWVRSGQSRQVQGSLPGPPGESETVTQTFRMETTMGVVPAAWRPTSVSGLGDGVAVTSLGGFDPDRAITQGETYSVTSEVPVASEERLRTAGTDYPAEIESRFTQLPSDSPERLAEFTAQLTETADTPYETARQVERWLQENKDYSLDVERPEGGIADSFVFDMEEGYCVYFATAMVTMLRSQDIPARFVTGYAPGQQVEDDRWVVRELDSHAWVEVYFPEVGWVRFDPTPGGPRQQAEQDRVEEARENGEENVDTAGSEDASLDDETGTDSNGTTTPAGGAPSLDNRTDTANLTNDPGLFREPSPVGGAGGGGADGIPRELIGFGVVVVLGVAAGIRRTDAVDRAQWMTQVYWQRRRGDPAEDVERAYARLAYVLSREHRPRRTGETHRRYLRTVRRLERDDRISRVGDLFVRARYGGGVTRAEADEAIDLVDALVRERTAVVRRLRNWR